MSKKESNPSQPPEAVKPSPPKPPAVGTDEVTAKRDIPKQKQIQRDASEPEKTAPPKPKRVPKKISVKQSDFDRWVSREVIDEETRMFKNGGTSPLIGRFEKGDIAVPYENKKQEDR